MEYKLTDAEITLMNIIWNGGEVKAVDISEAAGKQTGWKKNTVYTMLSRLIDKKLIERREPGFVCVPLVTKENVGLAESVNVVEKFYDGSLSLFARAFLREKKLTAEDIDELKRIIEESEQS